MASHKGSRWKRVVGIRPTGWTFRRKGGVSVWREGDVSILGVPYSEHSSWTDLCDAVSQLRPRRVVPTVNAATPAHRRSLVDRFAHLMDLSTDRSRLDVYLARAAELQRVKSEAGEQPSSAGTCAATGTATATAAAGAVAGAVCRVDLAAVDVGEQERILAQVQEQHRRRQAMQQRRAQLQQAQQERRRAAAQERKGKARKRGRAEDGSPAEEAEAEGKATSGRRGGEEAAVGSAACGQQRPQRRRQSSSAPPRGSQGGGTPLQPAAAASAAERTPAPLLRRSSCGRAARGACVVDLSIDSDDGADEQEEDQEEDQEDQGRSTSRAGLSSGGFTAAAHGSIRRFLASRAVAEEEAQHQ
ncbi:hypothetical protein HYH02_001954 [Chlamydomonas schloesseri]|uniref:DNA repair metallo-beta-lactamase domain-containing protein n=1 Tax=Chlamydomonas schloesseri TaxID=2026947 RepID=A0A836BBZ4_9CHLO|nr:hypothetical protein HYH02_001954 [Chlamydomonas schloesseri]|eukprot:KAG2453743.1 hypothetical protein HYH02_001954 [Chlamydomonas schloesseri]